MTDLIARLNQTARDIEGDGGTNTDASLMRAAATEIIRLREAVALPEVVPIRGEEGSEAGIQGQVRITAPRLGASMWRNNNGACIDDTGRLIRYGLGNDSKKLNEKFKSSDLIGIDKDGRFVAAEIKPPGWNLTPGDKRAQAQVAFMKHVVAKGGRAGFCQSIEDFERLMA